MRPHPANGEKPLIAITLGEPAGIGAEVIVRALADPAVRSRGRFVIYGLHELLCYAADAAEINPFWFRLPHEEIGDIASGVVVADFDEYATLTAPLKRPTAEGGHASLRFLEEAARAAVQGRVEALVTGPIHKISWRMAGRPANVAGTLIIRLGRLTAACRRRASAIVASVSCARVGATSRLTKPSCPLAAS